MGNSKSSQIYVHSGTGISTMFHPLVHGNTLHNIHDAKNRHKQAIDNVILHQNSGKREPARSQSMPNIYRDESSIDFMASGKSKHVDLINYTSAKQSDNRNDRGRVWSPENVIKTVKLTVHFLAGHITLLKVAITDPESITGDWLKSRFFESRRSACIRQSGNTCMTQTCWHSSQAIRSHTSTI